MNEQASINHDEQAGENKFTRELEVLSSAIRPAAVSEAVATPEPDSVESAELAGLDEDAYLEQLYNRNEFRERQARIVIARAAGDKSEERRLVGEQSNFVQSRVDAHKAVRGEVVGASESVTVKEDIRLARLAEVLKGLNGQETDEEVLKKFEILNDKGEIHLDSPLFHTVTRRAFEMYMKTVDEFTGLSYVEQSTGTRVRGIGKANQDRTIMHDLTAELVSTDLGMKFADARSLVAKARESRIPGSSEQNLYGVSARRAMKTAESYGYDVGTWADDQLDAFKRAIERLKENELIDNRR